MDLNPVDYLLWRALQQMVYCNKILDIDWLKCVLINSWTQLGQEH